MIKINFGLHCGDTFKDKHAFIENNPSFVCMHFEELVYENEIKINKPIGNYSLIEMLNTIIDNNIWEVIEVEKVD